MERRQIITALLFSMVVANNAFGMQSLKQFIPTGRSALQRTAARSGQKFNPQGIRTYGSQALKEGVPPIASSTINRTGFWNNFMSYFKRPEWTKNFWERLTGMSPVQKAAIGGGVVGAGLAAKYGIDHSPVFAETYASRRNDLKSQLWNAVTSGNFFQLEMLNKGGGVNLNWTIIQGRTPLTYAIEQGDIKLTRWLLEHGAEADTEDERKDSPMNLALAYNRPEIIKLLIEHDKDYFTESNEYLSQAIINNKFELADIFIENNTDINNSFLGEWSNPLINEIISHYYNKRHIDAMPALKYAVEHGADINYTNKMDSSTPIMVAAGTSNIPALEYLFKKGADLTKKNDRGQTVIDIINDRDKLKQPNNAQLVKDIKEKYVEQLRQKNR